MRHLFKKRSAVSIIGGFLFLGFFLLLSLPVKAELKRIVGADIRELRLSLQNSDSLDTKSFWEWRDRTNGFFTFNPTTSHAGMTRRLDEPTATEWPLHYFTSRTVESSIDSIIHDDASQAEVFDALTQPFAGSMYQKIAQGKDFVFYTSLPTEKYILVFVKPAIELKKTDGLFDFTDPEQVYLQDLYWTNVTVLSNKPMRIL